jgi:hypothetical protein
MTGQFNWLFFFFFFCWKVVQNDFWIKPKNKKSMLFGWYNFLKCVFVKKKKKEKSALMKYKCKNNFECFVLRVSC